MPVQLNQRVLVVAVVWYGGGVDLTFPLGWLLVSLGSLALMAVAQCADFCKKSLQRNRQSGGKGVRISKDCKGDANPKALLTINEQ